MKNIFLTAILILAIVNLLGQKTPVKIDNPYIFNGYVKTKDTLTARIVKFDNVILPINPGKGAIAYSNDSAFVYDNGIWKHIVPTGISEPIDTLQFNDYTPVSPANGTVYFDNDILNVKTTKPGVTQQVGQEFWTPYMRNNTGAIIEDGKVVYLSGNIGSQATIAKARSDVSTTCGTVLGLTTHDCAINQTTCLVTTSGLVNDINTSAWNEGDTLFLSSLTAGEMTKTRPTNGYIIRIGYVKYKHAVHGQVLVNVHFESPIYFGDQIYNRSLLFDSIYLTYKRVKALIDYSTTGALTDKGYWNASGNTLPSAGVLIGDKYTIGPTSAAKGFAGGDSLRLNDVIIALVNTPSQDIANWNKLNASNPAVSLQTPTIGSSIVGALPYNGIYPVKGKWHGGILSIVTSDSIANFNGSLYAASINKYGVQGYSTNNYGGYFSSSVNYGSYNYSISNYGSYISSTSGTGCFIRSTTGKGLVINNSSGNTSNLFEAQLNSSIMASINKDGKGFFYGGCQVSGAALETSNAQIIGLNTNVAGIFTNSSTSNPSVRIRLSSDSHVGNIVEFQSGSSFTTVSSIDYTGKIINNGGARLGGSTNNATFNNSGQLTLNGTAKTWDDVAISGFALGSGLNAPTFTTGWAGSSSIGANYFQGSTTNDIAYFNIQISHNCSANDSIRIHIHGGPTTTPVSTDTVVFRFTYSYSEIGATFPTVTVVDTKIPLTGISQWGHVLTNVLNSTTGTGLALSGIYNCSIERLQDNASDTYTSNYGVISIDAHAKINSLGSRYYNAK